MKLKDTIAAIIEHETQLGVRRQVVNADELADKILEEVQRGLLTAFVGDFTRVNDVVRINEAFKKLGME